MKNQVFNPYLPSYEYIPDGVPRVFNGRLYMAPMLYGHRMSARDWTGSITFITAWTFLKKSEW